MVTVTTPASPTTPATVGLAVAREALAVPAEPSMSGSPALDLVVGVEAVQRLIKRAERSGAAVPEQVRQMPRVLLAFGEILGVVDI